MTGYVGIVSALHVVTIKFGKFVHGLLSDHVTFKYGYILVYTYHPSNLASTHPLIIVIHCLLCITITVLSPCTQREEVPVHYGDYTPDHKVIYKFIKTLFHAAQVCISSSQYTIMLFIYSVCYLLQLTAECAIITLVSQ